MKRAYKFTGLFALMIIMSCSNHTTEVNIITPDNGQTFNTGNMIEVKAKINDADYIRKESLVVTSENGDTIYNYADTESHGNSHTFIRSFEATYPGNYTIKVSALGESLGSNSVMVIVN